MSEQDRLALADRAAAEYIRYVDFTRAQTVLLGMLPLLYGVFTFVYGDALWSGSIVYRTALAVPGAPQSWGVLFISLGVCTIWFAAKRRSRALTATLLLAALVLSMFMVTFLTEYIANEQRSAIPPTVVYMVFSLSFLNRARLSWQTAKAG